MANIREMLTNELFKLLDEYNRCTDDEIRKEILLDIELFNEVILGEKASGARNGNTRQFEAASLQTRNEA